MAIQAPAFVPYQPVSTDTNQAQLWSAPSQTFTGVTGPKTLIPSAQWAWAFCPSGWPGTPNPNYICLNGQTFNPNLLYEVVYTAANPLVLGVGFAAFRDLGSFLRYGTNAPLAGSNPIAGTVTTAMTVGASQSAAFIHGLIFYGFNEDEDGRIVFDGAWPQIDGRMMVMNIRWGQPNNLMYLYMGGDEAPVWWADYPNLARNLPANGMLHRCTATGTCPQILETFGSAEIYSEKMHASLCGFTCVADIPLPPNVYRYYSPGATHGGGTVSFTWSAPGSITPPAGQTYPSDPIPLGFTNNALQAAFINLLLNGTPMPPSAAGVTYPSLASGQLVPNTAAAEGFPTIPGFPFAGNQAWPPFVYDFGPLEDYSNQSGIPTIQPPNIQQVLPVYAPKVDADGNETQVGGIPSVLAQAPIGTYVGWNLTSIGWYTGQVIPGAGGSGAFWPFWDTKANRMTNGDPRLSLEERYGTHVGYVCVVAQAANKAMEQRFLLASDAPGLITLASASNVLSPFTPTNPDTSLANTLCLAKTHDFNGDGKSDLLWRDSSGNLAVWLMNGSTVSSNGGLGNVPSTWSIVGQRDFNGDGMTDLLWRDTAGDTSIWFMNGTQVLSSAGIPSPDPTWSVVATGDFNGDGMGDILWEDTSGHLSVWLMNGATPMTMAGLGAVPLTFGVAGVGDFNGDHKFDILWRDSSGNTSIWFMNGTQVASSAAVGNIPTTWTVVGIGDFDGNGISDIIWQDNSGDTAVWLMNGATVVMNGGLGNVPTTWTMAETGDFDGNGTSDLLWRDNAGNTAIWFMSGVTVSSTASVGNIPTTWTLQAVNVD
jgi:Alpha/beta hydrolase domain/FG-GAP-like repeat